MGSNYKLFGEIYRIIQGETWISWRVFTLQIEVMIVLEPANLLRKFQNYRSIKL